ncbi:MAG TPA: hypothetical protein VHM23_25300 [Actinomycetota bacterium]|jgi:hypothetical protein|nr:hypothetical protein [Actinomycetota bacterium]
MIGPYDPSDGSYPMRSFDNQGNFVEMTAWVGDDGASRRHWMDMRLPRAS